MKISVKKVIKSLLLLAIVVGLIGVLARNYKSIGQYVYNFFVPIDIQSTSENKEIEENTNKEPEKKEEEPEKPMAFIGEPEATENTKITNINMKYEIQPYSEKAILP